MGNCADRKKSEADMASFTNQKNDSYFFQKPNLSYIESLDSLSEKSHEELSMIIMKIKADLRYIQSYLPIFKKRMTSAMHRRLFIEVQKAEGVVYKGLCLSSFKPYVQIELQPVNQIKVTGYADPMYPLWFSLVVFKESLDLAETVNIKLLQMHNYGSNEIIEEVFIPIKRFLNQEVYEDAIKMGNSGHTKVYIRAQLIFDPFVFYEKNMKYIKEASSNLKDAFVRCKMLLGGNNERLSLKDIESTD